MEAENLKKEFKGFQFFIIFILIELCWILGTKVSEMLLDLMIVDINFSSIQSAEQFYHYSVAATVFFWGFFIDRNPNKRKVILIISNLIWIFGSFLLYFLDKNYQTYMWVQIIWGISFGANGALIGSYMGDLLNINQRGKLFSILMIFIYIIKGSSIAVNGLIGNSLNNWASPSLIFGIIGLVVIIFYGIKIKDPKLASVEPEFKEKINEGYEYSYKLNFRGIFEVLKTPTNILFLIQGVSGMIGVTIVTRYLNYWFTSDTGMGMDDTTAVLLLGAAVWIGALLGLNIAGRWVDKQFNKGNISKTIYIAILSLFLQVLSYFILTQLLKYPSNIAPENNNLIAIFQNYPVFYGFIVVFNFCIFFGTTIAPTLGTARTHINLPEHRGIVASLYDLFDFIGSGVALLIGSILFNMTSDYPMTILYGSLFWLISGMFWIFASFTIKKDYQNVREILQKRANK